MTAEDKTAVTSSAGPGDAVPPLSELRRLGKYQIEKKIGAGGMGAVFLARDMELKRTVALKVLPRDKAANPILVRRFRAEAQASAQLRHPNIVAVFDSGEADGYLYIAMEYVEGWDLYEMVSRRGTVPIRRSIEIIKQVASALQHAYEQNIVHRDIKPSNLLVARNGVVKLTDLGLARSVDDTLETNITRAGTTVGTVDYMSPEQARNSKLADIRSDLYSLGCTWYQMLTGSAPYPEGSVTNKLQAHAVKPIPDPRDKNPQVPEGLTAVIRRLMAKKPEDRYQTPADLIEDLNQSRLTQAAISREILSDLSDDEQTVDPDGIEEEGYSDDGYLDSDEQRQSRETPDQVPVRDDSSVRRKSTRSTTTHEPAETEPVSYKPKPRPSKTGRQEPGRDAGRRPARSNQAGEPDEPDEPGDEAGDVAEAESNPVGRRSKSRIGKPEADEPASSPTRSRSREIDPPDNDEAEPGRAVRKSKPRTGKTDVDETGSSSVSKPKAADSKPADSTASKPKGPGQKAMPPKRPPVEEPEETQKPLLNKDLLKYLSSVGALVLVIVGIGWLISSFGGNVAVDKNPFGVPPESPAENPAIAKIPGKAAADQSGDSGSSPDSKTESVDNSTAAATKPENGGSDFDVEKIPAWAAKEAETTGLLNFTVGPGAKSSTHFPTLEEALQAVPAAGAVLRLQGVGPFSLPLVELTQRRRIVIAGGSTQDRPVIALKPGAGQTTAGLKISNGALELRGLHFSIDRPVLTGPVNVVDVIDGQLIVQQCSITSVGAAADPAVAIVFQSTYDSGSVPRLEPNLLIDRVLIRGEGFGGVNIRRANVDAVIRDSLIVAGSAPAIEVGGHIEASIAEVATAKPRRIVRIQRCTLSAQNRIFDLSVDEGKPPSTAIALRDSICTAQGGVPNSAVAFAGKWPQVRTTSESWLTRMTWTSTNTVYLGFEQLIDLGSSFKVLDAVAWQRVWNVKPDPRQFQKLAFPDATLDELSVVLPQEFDVNGLSYREVKASDGGLPGCPVGKLSVLDVTSQQRAVALALRPLLPAAAVKAADPIQVRKVDLKKEDLGVVLNRGDWPSGTLFEASGGGIAQMTPAKVEGKSFKIVFRQTDGAALKIQPNPAKSAEAVKGAASALIAVTRGTMELTNAAFEGSPNPKANTPEWLIQANDATVILNGCRLLGSEAEGSRQVGLIRWITAVPGQPAGDAPALVIRECFLAGTGCGVRAECGRGPLIFRNTVLAVRGDALDLRPVRSGNALLAVLDAENLTISATDAAIRFEAAAGTEPVTVPMRLFLERCVFVPPVIFKLGEAANATLLFCVGPAIEQNQLEWWGSSNGAARQVVHLIRRDGDSGAPPSDERTGLTAWRKLWDKSGSLRFLTGDKGVYLAGELPNRWRDLKPGSFTIHKNSLAAAWGDGGKAIGANAQAVEEASLAKKSEVTKPNIPVQTKKNVGF